MDNACPWPSSAMLFANMSVIMPSICHINLLSYWSTQVNSTLKVDAGVGAMRLYIGI